MSLPAPLPMGVLRTVCDPQEFDFSTTAELDSSATVFGQQRAQEALRFGLQMHRDGYNIFAFGSPGAGKHSTVQRITASEAQDRPVPSDWCYVHCFDTPSCPRALRLPPGRGRVFRTDMTRLIDELRVAIPAAFESEEYQARLFEIEESLQEKRSEQILALRDYAREHHFSLIETPNGFVFGPLSDTDEVLSPDEINALPVSKRQEMEEAVKDLQTRLTKMMRQVPLWQKEMRVKIKSLNQDVAGFAIGDVINELKDHYRDLPEVIAHLINVRNDIIDHIDEFLPAPSAGLMFPATRTSDPLIRFAVNLLVDNGDLSAAPVVYEELPNHGNLIGQVEHQAHMGTLMSDFTLIKAGALHRANGGFLVLNALDVLRQPLAWDALKRVLRAREVRIQSLERALSFVATSSLEPEPIALDTKVIMVGEREIYYALSHYDPDFRDLFRVSADFDDTVERSEHTHQDCAQIIAGMARQDGVRPLERTAVARTIEHLSRLAGDARKLSSNIRDISTLLREADHWAAQAGSDVITVEAIEHTVEQQIYRSDRVRTLIYEQIKNGTMLIDTSGQTGGQVNALSVIQLDGFTFGRPTRITATTRIGDGNVIDIERETELGGAIHSKGVMILSSFLATRYSLDAPLSFTASLVFEQSYGMVDGDSASLAELCAILSALSDLPIHQSLAMTGSVNQHGTVQPIGGVNEKIEGFFDVCQALGETAQTGVLIPTTNVTHLMLRDDVVSAADAGQFAIYPVSNVDEAIELLTGTPAGCRGPDGSFPEGSVNARVEQRLQVFSDARRRFAQSDELDSGKSRSKSK